LGKFWLKVARFGQKESENARFTQKVSTSRQKFLKWPDSDKRFQHAAKFFLKSPDIDKSFHHHIARFLRKKNSEMPDLDNRFQDDTKI
jgi:hypothetical protein